MASTAAARMSDARRRRFVVTPPRKTNGAPPAKAGSKLREPHAHGQQDVMDRFFSFAEAAFCSPRHSDLASLAKEPVPEPDVLDYVFEHVESFTCADDDEHDYKHERQGGSPSKASAKKHLEYEDYYGADASHHKLHHQQNLEAFSLQRDNSLVETGPAGTPQKLGPHASAAEASPSPHCAMGHEGDLLDYCFETVESYTCADHGDGQTSEALRKSRKQQALEARAEAAIAAQLKARQDYRGRRIRQSASGDWLRKQQQQQHRPPQRDHPRERERDLPRRSSIPTEISTYPKKPWRNRSSGSNTSFHKNISFNKNYYEDPYDEEDNIMLYYRPNQLTWQ
ncbi:unnamed protein product [Pseudo-nitzschia multistriata]|uniref:Uncharacterized protein n=1 Tax=Pseudo-nitzschia multistriata TaxID=183589 RepID=A0A448ZAE6_9STRA|nr:unnamed protein product [Pseudo-nitzschia multistriata]